MVGLWDESRRYLVYDTADGRHLEYPADADLPALRSLDTQSPIFVDNMIRDYPHLAERIQAVGARALMTAPITAGERRLGALTVYAPRLSFFAEDDLELVQLLADQASVILESRNLIDEAARVRAREEATRMKDDFLSSAAHDLKTPLTTLIAQSQLMERRALRYPDAPADLAAIQRLTHEAQRLRSLVLELLDAARAEQGLLLSEMEEVDVAALMRESLERHCSDRHTCDMQGEALLVGHFDRYRIGQLIDNLIENAVKYSPDGGQLRVRIGQEGQEIALEVQDPGIGIPDEDLSLLFNRFYRGSNVNDRSFAGMGLGLFICRAIVEQHGGRIWATSEIGKGEHLPCCLTNQAK